jgi:tetratricopeptide (TPR) repeat protein
MSLMATIHGRRAYSLHLSGSRLANARRFDEANAKYEKALVYYEKALNLGLKNPKVMLAYAVLLLRRAQYDKAQDLMLQVEKNKSLTKEDRRQLRINYAICQWKRGRLDNAIQLMEEVAREFKNSTVYGSLGYMLVEKARETGDFERAEAFNMEAYEYDEEDAVTLDNLGQLYLAKGEREKAWKYFRQAHEQKPSQVDTLYYLGKMAYEDGRQEEARKYLEEALDNNYTALCTTTREQAEALLKEVEKEGEKGKGL